MRKSERRGPLSKTWTRSLIESNLQPVTRVGREQHAAQHQDAAQDIFLGHLEREAAGGSARAELIPRVPGGGGSAQTKSSNRLRRMLIHRPASSGSSTGAGAQLHGPSARFSRPSLCHSELRRDGERGKTEMLKKYGENSGASRAESDPSSF